ncbi:hypothetical protein ALI22I_20475 [Saccharothrix sp. ALI-22-I]|nr:hypothetical protein ALI22I_20475 [Saccharothrix sp. ALI-22-I]
MIGRIEEALWGRALTLSERTATMMTHFVHEGDGNGLGSEAWHPNLLFVTVPDVPFDARGTARRFCEWATLLSHLPLAFCVQDGAEKVGIPWDWPNLRALFMAGSTKYKLSQEMADICREGKRRGLHIHGGRVNTLNRIRHMIRLECVDSIDGSGFDRWRDTYIGGGLEFVNHELLDAAAQGGLAVIE